MLQHVLLRRKYGGETRGRELGARQRQTGAVFTRGKGLRSNSKMTTNSIRLGAQGIRKSQSQANLFLHPMVGHIGTYKHALTNTNKLHKLLV
jgi:hypothetical protein